MPLLPDAAMREVGTPDWLTGDWETLSSSPNIDGILRDSLYYPASGDDGLPVRLLSGFIHSFVYVDYGVKLAELEQKLDGFSGYRRLGKCHLQPDDLTPSGWRPKFKPTASEAGRLQQTMAMMRVDPNAAYALWLVYERNKDRSPSWGADRFSLLFLYADSVAAYEPLYRARGLAPKVVCMIRPGTGFGGNWADFRDPDGTFHRVVMAPPEPHPRWIITDRPKHDRQIPEVAPWPEFNTLVGTEARGDTRVQLWCRS